MQTWAFQTFPGREHDGSFAWPSTYFDLKFFLEELIGRPVDLVTRGGLRAELRARVERESLMEFLAALGHDVEIRVRRTRKAHGQVSVVAAA